MTTLVWDEPGERFFETGVDKAVLYLKDGRAVAWNGLTSVEDTSSSELKSYYLDGVKYLNTVIPGDYSGKMKAFTYPDEFDVVNGIASMAPGLFYHDQNAQAFNLSYRTKIGNDIDGADHGYKIHLLYNVTAIPDSSTFDTVKEQITPTEFSWSLSGVPPKMAGVRPTAHLVLDSRTSLPEVFEALENILYGTDVTNPRFPSVNEVKGMYGSFGSLIITDNGDGTWTATDHANDYVTMLDDTTFQIAGADAEFIDATTYTISTTTPD